MEKHIQRMVLGIIIFSVMFIVGCQSSKIGVQEFQSVFEINFNEQDKAFEDIAVSMPREWSVRHITKAAYSIPYNKGQRHLLF
jgi:PBP1b-binding outer membrane lipoprotein LpoB